MIGRFENVVIIAAIAAVFEVVGTIALAVLGVIIANHFIVKFW